MHREFEASRAYRIPFLNNQMITMETRNCESLALASSSVDGSPSPPLSPPLPSHLLRGSPVSQGESEPFVSGLRFLSTITEEFWAPPPGPRVLFSLNSVRNSHLSIIQLILREIWKSAGKTTTRKSMTSYQFPRPQPESHALSLLPARKPSL